VQRYEHLGSNKWKIIAKDIEALKKEVMQWSLTHDINISSLQAETETLEDVFRNLTKAHPKA
jgi:ABC-2 type transport system ATP-binding protein